MFQKSIIVWFLFILAAHSHADTGFLKGEQVSGLNKICIYSGARGDFTITQSAASVCRPSADDGRGTINSIGNNGGGLGSSSTQATIGFLSGEQTSGLNKICIYDSARGRFTITQSAASVCRPSARQQ